MGGSEEEILVAGWREGAWAGVAVLRSADTSLTTEVRGPSVLFTASCWVPGRKPNT